MTYKTKTADEYEKVIAKASIENKKKIANIYDEVITDVLIEKGVLELDEIEELERLEGVFPTEYETFIKDDKEFSEKVSMIIADEADNVDDDFEEKIE